MYYSILQHLRFISEACIDSQLSLKASSKCTHKLKSFKLNLKSWFWYDSDLHQLKSFQFALLRFLLMKSILKTNINVAMLYLKVCWYISTLLPPSSSALSSKCLEKWSAFLIRALCAMPIDRKLNSKLTCRLKSLTLLSLLIAAFRFIMSISI